MTDRQNERKKEQMKERKNWERGRTKDTFQATGLALSLKPTKCQTAMEQRERKRKIVENTSDVLCGSWEGALQHKGQALTRCFGQGTATFLRGLAHIPLPQQRAMTCAQSNAKPQSGASAHDKRKVSVSNRCSIWQKAQLCYSILLLTLE